MAITSLHLAKVLHNFNSSVDGQLSVKAGECLLVLNKIDSDWVNCRDVVIGDEGLVPLSYVKEMAFKLRQGEQCMFLAIADFTSGVEGDLEFRTGDLIIGEKPVNDEWWEGRLALQPLNSPLKMFPLTFVVEVSSDTAMQQSILQQHDNYVPQQKPPFKGIAVSDFEGRYEDELTLRCNEEVNVLGEIDENWYSGCRLRDINRQGIFPKSFVQYSSPIVTEESSSAQEVEVPLSRTSRSHFKEIFDPAPTTQSSASAVNFSDQRNSYNSGQRELYQNVSSIYAQAPSLPTVLETSPAKFEVTREQPTLPPPAPPIQESPSNNDNRVPSAYINFDEIFQEVRNSSIQSPVAVSLSQKPAYDSSVNYSSAPIIASPPMSSPQFNFGNNNNYQSLRPMLASSSSNNRISPAKFDDSSKYQQTPVFDSRAISQLSSTFSLDDIVHYEMQRAIVEKTVQPSPPARPPPPPVAKPMPPPLIPPPTQTQQQPYVKQPAIDPFAMFETSFTDRRTISPQTVAPMTLTSTTATTTSSTLGIARLRPMPSISPPPPPSLTSRQSRSVSMNFADFSSNRPPVIGRDEQPIPQLLPAYKPERPPAVAREESRNSAHKPSNQGDKRAKVIDELISTEESYLADLELCCRIITSTPVPPVGAGIACNVAGASHPLLGNMAEVAEVSRHLLDSLKAETAKSKDSQLIGSCFVKLANDLEAVYSRYCQHQPGAAAYLVRLNQVDATRAYVIRVTEVMKNERTSAFSLESLLLKPVQRILKYPLLLSELTRNTPPQHPDTEALASASGTLSKLTSRLNETRRRLDLVLKYRRSPSLTTRLSKLTVHTIRKKTARFSQRISDSINFSSAASDEEFSRREQEFVHADRLFRQTVRLLQRWAEAYNEYAQAQRELLASVNDFTSGDVAGPQFVTFREQWSRAFDTGQLSVRVGKVNALSVDPLRQLVDLFGGPSNVIKKRADKLLDFRRLVGHHEGNNAAADNELDVARTDFIAINAQLSDELPSLCRFSYRVLLLACVSYLRHYSLISRTTVRGLNPVSSPEFAASSLASSLQRMTTFSFVKPESTTKTPTSGSKGLSERAPLPMPRASFSSSSQPLTPVVAPPSAPPVVDTSSSTTLSSKYPVSDLFITIEPTVSRQLLELALPSGAIVGILKRHDPTGQPDRWFVDTGVVKGFVPRKSLRPFTPSPSVDAMLLNLMD